MNYGTVKLTKPEKIEVPIMSGSRIDPIGRLFEYDGNVYRAIFPRAVEVVTGFLNSPNLNKIFDAGLVFTEISDLKAVDYGLVVKHEKIDYKSLPFEWPKNMLRDDALMILNLGRVLYRNNYNFKDGQIYNSFFDFHRPVFIDFGSILPLSNLPNSRRLEPSKFPWEWSGVFINQSTKRFGVDITDRAFDIRDSLCNKPECFYDEMEDLFKGLKLEYSRTEWTGYGARKLKEETNPKVASVAKILRSLDKTSLIDIGANKGRFSIFANDLGFDVVAFDIDEPSIARLYEQTKKEKRNILPLVMDFLKPTRRIRGHIKATKRLRCDVSLSLALFHHLCLRLDVDLYTMAKLIASFTNKDAIIEWVGPDDPHVSNWHKHEWYSLDNLISSMRKVGFELEIILPSRPPTRKIIHFKRRV